MTVSPARLSLGSIAAGMLLAGLQAAFAPRSFYDDFPLGRGWIAAEGGAYDEHLVRDVGFLFLALIAVTVWVAVRDADPRGVAIAWLVQGIGHLVYHVGHLEAYDGVDRFGLVASLIMVPVLAAVALWDGVRRRAVRAR